MRLFLGWRPTGKTNRYGGEEQELIVQV